VNRRLAALALAVAGLLGRGAALVAEGVAAPELPAVLTIERSAKDPVFGVLIGLLESGTYGTLTLDRLERELGKDVSRSRLPYKKLRELRREPAAGGARVTLRFDAALAMPIPYSILGYHPGKIGASVSCAFREWNLGSVGVAHAGKAGAETLLLEDVHAFALERGRLLVDIDWWLDALMGAALDDTEVEAVVVLRRKGRWTGLALGHSRKGENRSGAFDFSDDRIVFPVSPEIKTISRQLRHQVERLLAQRP